MAKTEREAKIDECVLVAFEKEYSLPHVAGQLKCSNDHRCVLDWEVEAVGREWRRRYG